MYIPKRKGYMNMWSEAVLKPKMRFYVIGQSATRQAVFEEGGTMRMNIPYNVKGKQRTKLAEEVSAALQTMPRYLGVPTCAYQIGECLLDRNGTLRIPDTLDDDAISGLVSYLKEKGYDAEADVTEDRLIISLPREGFTDSAVANLRRLVESKGGLMARAFMADKVAIAITDDVISFPWFPFTAEPDEVSAYSTFVAKLCDMAKRQKRVVVVVAETGNDKYAFRCFLLRLGFIGDEYKIARKVLLRNLTGNSAFRYDAEQTR